MCLKKKHQDETQQNLHEATDYHCPQCGECDGKELTSENLYVLCKLCLIEREDRYEGNGIFLH